jgi:flagellar motor switch protein FliM
MPRITAEDLLERAVSALKEKESEKKKELQEIQTELRRNQKALEVLSRVSPNTIKKPKRDV